MNDHTSPVGKAAGATGLYPNIDNEFLRASAPVPILHAPRRQAQPSPLPDNLSASPDSPDSLRREIAARRVGGRSLTPYPPPQFSPRVNTGSRSVTPYPNIHRMPSLDLDYGTPNSAISCSPFKENESFVRSQAPSPSPNNDQLDWEGSSVSPSPKRSLCPEDFVFGVPTNTPYSRSRSVSISEDGEDAHGMLTPLAMSRIIEDRLLEIHVFQKMKEFTYLPVANIGDTYESDDEDISIICPPNTPVAQKYACK